MRPPRHALLLVPVLLLASSAPPVRADDRLMPADVRSFRMDDPKAAGAYKAALKLEFGGASMKFAVKYGPQDSDVGAVVTGKGRGNENYAFGLIRRRFGEEWEVRASLRLLDVRGGGQAGLEADLFDAGGTLQSFTFAGLTPNPSISGVSGYANKDKNAVGSQVDFPGTDAVDISMTQLTDRFSIRMRATGQIDWQTVFEEQGTQPTGRQVGFGASLLERGNRVAFSQLGALGEVNGARERADIRDIARVRSLASDFRIRVTDGRLDVRGARSDIRGARLGMERILRDIKTTRDDGLYRESKTVRDTLRLVNRARLQGNKALKILEKLGETTETVAFKKSPEDKLRKLADGMLQDLALSTGGLRGWKTKKPKNLPVVLVPDEK